MLAPPCDHDPCTATSKRIASGAALAGICAVILSITGCSVKLYDPTLATRPYPDTLAQSKVVQIQAVPLETTLQIINATATDYANIDIWINRRFVQHVAQMNAGETLQLKIDGFRDVWGQCPQPGGFWRTRPATQLVFVQIEIDDKQPLIGLVTVVPKEARY